MSVGDKAPVHYGIMTGDPDTDFQLSALDRELEEAMSDLVTEKQRRFVELLAASDGSTSATQAAIAAGYKPKTAYVQASENIRKPHIQRALKVLRIRHALVTGIPTSWKRQKLVEIISIATSGDKPQLMAGTRAIEVLAKLDGELEVTKHGASGGASGGVQIVIQTGIPERPGITVDAEVIQPLLDSAEKHNKEHKDDD